jgi:preprotein translocase subunit SecF
MSFRFKLAPDNTNFDFMGKRFITFAVSLILVFGSIGLVAFKGLNFGVDFAGGTLIEIKTPTVPNLDQLRATLQNLNVGSVSLQEFGDPQNILIRLGAHDGDTPEGQAQAVNKIKQALTTSFNNIEPDYRRIEYVGPQVGKELIQTGVIAMILSMIGVLIYVAARFEWQFGVACVMAVLRDAIITVGFFALTGWEFDLATMGAVLLVAGYSLNDTIVVFDRVRENLRKYKKMSMYDLCNLSVNQTLSRSLMTSFTTLLALSALAIFGGPVIRGFTCALIVGIVVGTFSSTFVAAATLLTLGIRSDKNDKDISTSPSMA